MKFKTLAFLSILLILSFTGCESKKDNEIKEEKKEEIKPKIVTYKLETTDNKIINVKVEDSKIIFEDFPNKVVLINFFATWCPPCIAEIPNLNKLQEKYKDKFVVIGALLEREKTNDALLKFIKEHNIKYSVTNSNHNFLLSNKIGPVNSIPTMFMVDTTSNIYQKYVGIVPMEMMEIDIKKALKK